MIISYYSMYDNGDSFQVIAEVHGVNKEDLVVRIQGNYLELSGTRKSDAPEGYKTHRVERDLSTFTRSFTLKWYRKSGHKVKSG